MSKKEHLLTENQVRQFMKLANLQPLSSGFVNGLTEKAAFDKGQQTEVGGKADESPTKGQDKEDGDKAYEDLEEGTEGVEESDMGDVGLDPMGGGREVSVDDFLAALEVALENVLGDEVEVDQEEDAEEEEIVDLENGDEMEMEMGAVEEDPALQEMISTITKRVAKRIVKEALQKKK